MSREEIKISVITPVYNDEAFVGDAIRSVLSQTHRNIELLIIDDCSDDNSRKIIESFSDPRIKLFRNDSNQGAAFSRNLAIEKSTGDYVAFLDGDDLWHPQKLELQLEFMMDHGYSFSCTDYLVINEASEETGILVTAPKRITHKMFIRSDYIGCLTAMYKKDVCPGLKVPTNLRKRNDYALWLQLSAKTACYSLHQVLAAYRKREANSISSGKKMHLLSHHIKLFKTLYRFGTIKSLFYSYRNVFYYFIRRIFYKRSYKGNLFWRDK